MHNLIGRRQVVFIQATEPGAYPPLINAAHLMAEAGWNVTFLSAPISGKQLPITPHPKIQIRSIPKRVSHVLSTAQYVRYILAAGTLALRLKPDVVYASDPLGAIPGLLAARIVGAKLVYHEHDSPNPGSLSRVLNRARAAAVRQARVVIFPNATRARVAQSELDFSSSRTHIVWNVPRRSELPATFTAPKLPLLLHYHGSVNPERLPESIIDAIVRFQGQVRLRIVGYESPGAPDHVRRLVERGYSKAAGSVVDYIGQCTRQELLKEAARAHVGLALVPTGCEDIS